MKTGERWSSPGSSRDVTSTISAQGEWTDRGRFGGSGLARRARKLDDARTIKSIHCIKSASANSFQLLIGRSHRVANFSIFFKSSRSPDVIDFHPDVMELWKGCIIYADTAICYNPTVATSAWIPFSRLWDRGTETAYCIELYHWCPSSTRWSRRSWNACSWGKPMWSRILIPPGARLYLARVTDDNDRGLIHRAMEVENSWDIG